MQKGGSVVEVQTDRGHNVSGVGSSQWGRVMVTGSGYDARKPGAREKSERIRVSVSSPFSTRTYSISLCRANSSTADWTCCVALLTIAFLPLTSSETSDADLNDD